MHCLLRRGRHVLDSNADWTKGTARRRAHALPGPTRAPFLLITRASCYERPPTQLSRACSARRQRPQPYAEDEGHGVELVRQHDAGSAAPGAEAVLAIVQVQRDRR